MTNLVSASQEAAEPYSGDSADEASNGARTTDSDRRHTGRHRAAEEPQTQPEAELVVEPSPDPLPLPTALATLLPGGVGAAAFHAAIDAARTSVSRQPIQGRDDERIAGTGHGQPSNQAGT